MLDAFLNPRSVAVVGASRTPGKLGHSVLRNILRHGYPGEVYPVNPKASEILELKCYATVQDVPGRVDLAIILIPGEQVAQALRQCAEKGAKGAIIISAGFREVGAAGWQREREIVEIARQHGMSLLGPNCLGIIDTVTSLNASFAAGMPRRGTIGFMSQSGALCTSILDMALSDDVGFSRFVSLGNKADVDEIGILEAWHEDPNTQVIAAYLEGIEKGPQFMRVARRVSQTKPIVVVKAGTTTAGSRAVSSHTGTLAGSDRAYDAAFRQCGVIRARSVQELFDYSIAFARQPLLPNDRIAIITNAGGPGVMATDACERAGLQVAFLQSETMAALRQVLPPAASVLNPVDLLGDAPASRYRLALEAIVADPNVGGVLVILTPQAMTQAEETAHAVGEIAHVSSKPIFGCYMGREAVQSGVRVLNRYGVPNYPVPERAMAALAVMMQHRRWRERPPLAVEPLAVDRERVGQVFDRVRSEGRVALGDIEAQEVLEAYGIATPHAVLVRTADEAVRRATEIGFPVAVKVASPDIPHKTDAGAVRLNVSDPAEVRQAFDLVTYRARRYSPNADIFGCVVQEMATDGREVVVSMEQDPHFGPVLAFGLGGACAEVLSDVACRVAPFDRSDARQMIAEVQGYDLLRGTRGEHASDLEALTGALLRLSALVIDWPEIAAFDISPIMVFGEGQGVKAIDMRLVLG